nr:hypothetical protein JVH1_4212 [Rhodococcus sp. JVH1]
MGISPIAASAHNRTRRQDADRYQHKSDDAEQSWRRRGRCGA